MNAIKYLPISKYVVLYLLVKNWPMKCEGEITIFDKEGKFLKIIKCPGPEECFRDKIWGSNNMSGLGINGSASEISGIPAEELQAFFNSKCSKRKTE